MTRKSFHCLVVGLGVLTLGGNGSQCAKIQFATTAPQSQLYARNGSFLIPSASFRCHPGHSSIECDADKASLTGLFVVSDLIEGKSSRGSKLLNFFSSKKRDSPRLLALLASVRNICSRVELADSSSCLQAF